jgi:hypothetical protein
MMYGISLNKDGTSPGGGPAPEHTTSIESDALRRGHHRGPRGHGRSDARGPGTARCRKLSPSASLRPCGTSRFTALASSLSSRSSCSRDGSATRCAIWVEDAEHGRPRPGPAPRSCQTEARAALRPCLRRRSARRAWAPRSRTQAAGCRRDVEGTRGSADRRTSVPPPRPTSCSASRSTTRTAPTP